jgi:hypothetical protein
VDDNTGRFIAVNLTDAEWRALRTVTPDPVAWIRTQIHQLLGESGHASALGSGGANDSRHDALCTVEFTD